MASASPAANGVPPPSQFDWDLNSVLAGIWSHKLSIFVLAPSVTVFLWFFIAYQTSPLKKYPGPFLAGLWRTPTCSVRGWLTLRQDGPISGDYGRSTRASTRHA